MRIGEKRPRGGAAARLETQTDDVERDKGTAARSHTDGCGENGGKRRGLCAAPEKWGRGGEGGEATNKVEKRIPMLAMGGRGGEGGWQGKIWKLESTGGKETQAGRGWCGREETRKKEYNARTRDGPGDKQWTVVSGAMLRMNIYVAMRTRLSDPGITLPSSILSTRLLRRSARADALALKKKKRKKKPGVA